MEGGDVAFGDIRQHPHGRDVGHRIRSRRIARLDKKTGCRVSRRDATRNRTPHDQRRIGLAILDDHIDLGIGLAENAHGIARRTQRTLGGLLVGNSLFQVLLRDCSRLIKLLEARQIAGGQIQYALRGNQVRVGREQVRAVDGKQSLALLHLVADPGEQIDDLALKLA
jgi:hypothetical protein